MLMSSETFARMIKTIRNIYGKEWRSDLDDDREAQIVYFTNCRSLIPDEMADEMIATFTTTRARAPFSPYDILETYVKKNIEEARSCAFVLQKLIEVWGDHKFTDEQEIDDYIYHNLIPILPCPNGVKEFYTRNKEKVRFLKKRDSNVEFEYLKIKLGIELEEDYKKQLFFAEREAIIKKIDSNPLIDGNTHNQLEA